MSLLKLFAGPTPEKLEQKADRLSEAQHWSQAKQTYEHALAKMEKRSDADPRRMEQLAAKIQDTREALAREHRQNAENLAEGGYFDDAREMLALALEISTDPGFKKALEDRLREIDARPLENTQNNEILPDLTIESDDTDQTGDMDPPAAEASEDEYFFALLGPLPDEVRGAYLEYGPDFKTGYVALNRGDFQTAASHLSRALQENPQPESYVPLELAAALLNLDRSAEARELLEKFLEHHPRTLPAYQLLCEILWEQRAFERVEALLASTPDEVAESLAVVLLKGETFYQAGQFERARDFYGGFFDTYGWDDSVARQLAKTHEALGDVDSARHIYRELMDRCNSCHARIDPEIKDSYAELSFAHGTTGTDLLELYLALAREIPANAARYFDRISRIYQAQGNPAEARRFRSLALRAPTESTD